MKDVERGSNGYVQVVCGAPNVQADMLAAWIPPGVTVPSTLGKEPFVIEPKEIRGQKSNGMLASPAELGISEDHTGILEIKSGEVTEELARPGISFKRLYNLDDAVVDIENKMFTHRPDLFGILGIARELAGIQQLGFKSPDWYTSPPQFESQNEVRLDINVHDKKLVPRFMAVAVKDVNVGQSAAWVQAALTRVGIRPINNIVDITNFIMQLTGQPMHAYDLDKLLVVSKSQPAKLETRMSRKGEKITLLGGKQLELQDDSTVLITSNDVPVGIGGVMGGSDTEVDNSTKNIVLECATFDMYNIRRSAMQYGLFTDAVTRFTKGQSVLQNDKILAYALKFIQDMTGGTQASEVKDERGDLPNGFEVTTSSQFINDRLGEKLTAEDIANLLKNVEFEVQVNGEEIIVKTPFWRTDIEIPEDVVEEVGRLYGYDRLPQQLPKRSIKPASANSLLSTKSKARNILSAAGANEVLTYTFVHGDLIDRVGQNKDNAYQLANALSPDLQYYRLSLIPSLLEKVHPNIKQGYSEFALFEINPVHAKGFVDEDKLPMEDQRLALVFAVDDKNATQNYAGAPYYQAKKYFTELLSELGITDLVFEPAVRHEPKQAISQAAIAPFEKLRAAVVKAKSGEFIGEIGEFRTAVRKNLKLPQFVAGFELDVNILAKLAGHNKPYKPVSRFPRVEQDITLKVKAGLGHSELFSFIRSETEKLQSQRPDDTQASIESLDVYQKDHDSKHVSFRFSLSSYEKTLTTEEVNDWLNQLAEAAKTKFGAERI